MGRVKQRIAVQLSAAKRKKIFTIIYPLLSEKEEQTKKLFVGRRRRFQKTDSLKWNMCCQPLLICVNSYCRKVKRTRMVYEARRDWIYGHKGKVRYIYKWQVNLRMQLELKSLNCSLKM